MAVVQRSTSDAPSFCFYSRQRSSHSKVAWTHRLASFPRTPASSEADISPCQGRGVLAHAVTFPVDESLYLGGGFQGTGSSVGARRLSGVADVTRRDHLEFRSHVYPRQERDLHRRTMAQVWDWLVLGRVSPSGTQRQENERVRKMGRKRRDGSSEKVSNRTEKRRDIEK